MFLGYLHWPLLRVTRGTATVTRVVLTSLTEKPQPDSETQPAQNPPRTGQVYFKELLQSQQGSAQSREEACPDSCLQTSSMAGPPPWGLSHSFGAMESFLRNFLTRPHPPPPPHSPALTVVPWPPAHRDDAGSGRDGVGVWVMSVSSHVSTLGLKHLLVPSSDLN